MRYASNARRLTLLLFGCFTMLASPGNAASLCADEQATPQIPTDPALCAQLDPIVRKPSALPLDQYEVQLNRYVTAMCHRNFAAGWQMDKTVRDTGPFIATLGGGQWTGTYFGTHAPVLIWYSPEMMAWLHANRPSDPAKAPAEPAPIPDGAIMVKEMYSPPPASACRIPDLLRLRPNTQGMAVMVRDSAAARDGWFWGAIGWQGWTPDWPPPASNSPAFAGFGQYCTNCHASARDNQTFASLANIKDEPGSFLNFLSEDFFRTQSDQTHTRFSQVLLHEEARAQARKVPPAEPPLNAGYLPALHLPGAAGTAPPVITNMPSQSYDHAWIPGAGPNPASAFVTSDQCVGCHTAGGTGLQYDMTIPGPDGLLVNLAPYGTWRTSPMGLAGRDPIFFAQLASETQTFHAAISPKVQDTCLGCHGILGQRQAAIDSTPASACPDFLRQTVDAVPFPPDNPSAPQAAYGGLARDGVSCTACHHMVLGEADTAKYRDAAQNRCVAQRQEYLNSGNTGFARTFTGSFLVGATDALYGPFLEPRQMPMQHALGVLPAHDATVITSPELCGTCHTVHLPVMRGAQELGHTYEQTTYPEWAFSDYRTGETPDGKLPFGPGPLAQSCQDCHMPKTAADGSLFLSKIAGIQEHSNFPEVENGLPAKDIDLPVREGLARHVLVGLNVFLIDMAAQFSSVLGIATQDPMLGSMGMPPLDFTRQAMLDQAANKSATLGVSRLGSSGDQLTATVTVTNKTGHKLPSGVGFRRAFVDFRVLDAAGKTLWESGRTNSAGVLIDQRDQPLAGEVWWKPDCSARTSSGNPHQPHYQEITRQDQVQIYQELVTAPPAGVIEQCGPHAAPAGELTTSFLSICGKLKDNRLLPAGFLKLEQRVAISRALGAGADMAEDTDPVGVGNDPDYQAGGGDTLIYRIPRGDIAGQPAAVDATLYYQAIPPFFLQDRFCTATGTDRDRLAYLATALKLTDTPAADWKLRMVTTGRVALPR
jgi:Cytochrome P460